MNRPAYARVVYPDGTPVADGPVWDWYQDFRWRDRLFALWTMSWMLPLGVVVTAWTRWRDWLADK